MKRSTHVVAWSLQVGLGLLIAMGGAAKLGGDAAMVQLFDQLGVGQWFRLAVGALEVAGGIGLLAPRLRALAAAGLVVLLLCATAVNLTVLDASPVLSLVLATVAAVILWVRRRELAPRTQQTGDGLVRSP